jgi:hypothetical protein
LRRYNTEEDPAIHVVDLVTKAVTTITLPVSGYIANVMIPQNDFWVVTVDDPSAGGEQVYSLTLDPVGRDPRHQFYPTVLSTIDVHGADAGAARTLPTKMSLVQCGAAVASTGGGEQKRVGAGQQLFSGPNAYAAAATGVGRVAELAGTSSAAATLQIHGHTRDCGRFGDNGAAIAVTHCDTLSIVATVRQAAGADKGSSNPHAPAATAGAIEVVDVANGTLRQIEVPGTLVQGAGRSWNGSRKYTPAPLVAAFASADGRVLTCDAAGVLRTWEVAAGALAASLGRWHQMIGADANKKLGLSYENVQGRKEFERFSGLGNSTAKHGKEDPNNDPHVGGNTWAGGTGGRDTAGLGGKGGPCVFPFWRTLHLHGKPFNHVRVSLQEGCSPSLACPDPRCHSPPGRCFLLLPVLLLPTTPLCLVLAS